MNGMQPGDLVTQRNGRVYLLAESCTLSRSGVELSIPSIHSKLPTEHFTVLVSVIERNGHWYGYAVGSGGLGWIKLGKRRFKVEA